MGPAILAFLTVVCVWFPLMALLVHKFDPLWVVFVLVKLTGG